MGHVRDIMYLKQCNFGLSQKTYPPANPWFSDPTVDLVIRGSRVRLLVPAPDTTRVSKLGSPFFSPSKPIEGHVWDITFSSTFFLSSKSVDLISKFFTQNKKTKVKKTCRKAQQNQIIYVSNFNCDIDNVELKSLSVCDKLPPLV